MTSSYSAAMILVPLVLAIAASARAAKSAASTTELPGKSVILIPFIACCSSANSAAAIDWCKTRTSFFLAGLHSQSPDQKTTPLEN